MAGQGLNASCLAVRDSLYSKLHGLQRHPYGIHHGGSHHREPNDNSAIKTEKPRMRFEWRIPGTRFMDLLRDFFARIFAINSSFIIAIAVTSIAAYFSQIQFRHPTRFTFIICSALNLILTAFTDEIPPSCDGYGMSCFCADCAVTSSPAPAASTLVLSSFLAPDYALSPEGAIVMGLTSPTVIEHYSPEHYSIPTPPIAVIEEDIHISCCWKFAGSSGHVTLKLAKAIQLTNVTIYYPDHRELLSWKHMEVPKLLKIWALLPLMNESHTAPVAPVFMTGWEYFYTAGNIPKPAVLKEASTFVHSRTISYNVALGTKQTFSIDLPVAIRTTIVVIEVIDNWGGSATCLHRFAIHGDEEEFAE